MKPLAIDLFCGLGGWTDGLIEEGWHVIGFDIERHRYGDSKYPAQLVLQDVLTLHGRQFKDVDLIVASPPCQEFSYMAMPWSLAKEKQARILADETGVERKRLTALFDACFRIQREAIEAAGHFIPLIVENVRGAQKWVGRSRYNYGSFHLWGDVPALMPSANNFKPKFILDDILRGQRRQVDGIYENGVNVMHICDCQNPEPKSGIALVSNECKIHNQNPYPIPDGYENSDGMKNSGGSWFNIPGKGGKVANNNPVHDGTKGYVPENTKALGKTGLPRILPQIVNKTSSNSNARKAASAAIAKIPMPLAQYIGKHFKPVDVVSYSGL
jgi:hypothetical protein